MLIKPLKSFITPTIMKEARRKFAVLLSRPTKEKEWQEFFKKHPYVISEALPLSLKPYDVVSLGRLGKSEPDFIFYQRDREIPILGVIEIKRPDTKILRLPRDNIIRLSADAETAYAQAKYYAKRLERKVFFHPSTLLAVGNHAYVFIILGMSDEIAKKVTSEILKNQYSSLLDSNFQIIPYDTLFKLFSEKICEDIYFLYPKDLVTIPTIRFESGVLIVDYLGGGTEGVQENFNINDFHGIFVDDIPKKHLRLLKPGICPYCGKLDGARSLSQKRMTPCGEIENFFHDTKLVRKNKKKISINIRKMECTVFKKEKPLQFHEEYNGSQVKQWFEKLKEGYCMRCGSKKISYYYLNPMDYNTIERWRCTDCNFWHVRHTWGRESDGA